MDSLPSEIIEYISQFNTVSEKIRLKLTCHEYNKVIKVNMRDRSIYKRICNIVKNNSAQQYAAQIVLVKWNSDVIDPTDENIFGQRLPIIAGNGIFSCGMFDGNRTQKYHYRYGLFILLHTVKILKEYSSLIEFYYLIDFKFGSISLLYDLYDNIRSKLCIVECYHTKGKYGMILRSKAHGRLVSESESRVESLTKQLAAANKALAEQYDMMRNLM